MGCMGQVWLEVRIDDEGKMRFGADNDYEISRGFCFCLVWMLDDCDPEKVLNVKTDDLVALYVIGLLKKAKEERRRKEALGLIERG